ncbi:MAG: recombinase family protein [Bacteroidetes bacterium]|nr:recombinase family protein [Bacteroidota bacterium]
MFFMFSQLDNDMRREKTVAGMREMLRQGFWATKAPVGYSHVPGADRENRIVIDEKGKLLRKAFLWKADEGLSNTEIVLCLNKLGLKVSKQRLTEIFKNPFYCGIIVSTLVEGEIIKGKHPKLISEEVFLKVNEIQSKNHHGYKQQKERSQFPLKQFAKCDSCGTPMTAYRMEKKNAEYYKCNKIGCKCNRNTEILHKAFIKKLGEYAVEEKGIPPMHRMMSYVFNNLNESNSSNKETFSKALKACQEKINTVEEKFVLGEIDRALYEKFITKYGKEKADLEKKLAESSFELSNLDEYVNYTLRLASKLQPAWDSAEYDTKLKIQNLVFPEGVRFNKENNDYRTARVNSFFAAIPALSAIFTQKRSGLNKFYPEKSALVAPPGIEPGFKV